MIPSTIFISLLLLLLIIRSIRMVKFYDEWKVATETDDRRVARTNFFIHVIICFILFLMISGLGYYLGDMITGN